MNETSKTISFVMTAVAVLFLAWVIRPVPPPVQTDALVGKSLFPALDDPLKAKRMRIVTFDEGTSQVRDFEVAQVNGAWSLPSHKNYPADAKDQMASAAASLVDLKVLAAVSNDARDHALYGVVEPKSSEDQFGQKGVGKLVTIEDENSKPLARIIIGKEDKPTHSDEFAGSQTQLRFVRIPGQDQVYRVQMNADKFSTNFADWIETDLLKLSPWDVTDIKLHDYSVADKLTPTGEVTPVMMPRADIDLSFDDKSNKWNLKQLEEYKDSKPKEVKLTDAEELNTTKLNDLKTALSNLKIIDVARKPPQLSADLKTEKGAIRDEGMEDLMRRGFLPAMVHNQFQLVSNDGEAIVSMKDGVQYVLRFGEVAGIDSGAEADKKKTADAKSDGKKDEKGKKSETAGEKSEASIADEADKSGGEKSSKTGGLSRYIMVMAQFNPDLIPKPVLQPLPEIKKAPEKATTGKTAEPTKTEGAKAASADKKGDGKSDAKSEDKKDDKKDAKKDDSKSGAAAKDENEDQEALEAERDKIEKENQRTEDEYKDKIKKGEQRAKELNARFADWYYVVGDETYRKIHLGQGDIVKKKAPEDKNAGHTAGPKDPFNIPGLPSAAGK